MEQFKIITGKYLTHDIYQKTWDLDNTIFDEESKISQELSDMFFKNSNNSTIVLFDTKNNEVVGYISPFLMTEQFYQTYISTDKYFKNISKEDFYNPKSKSTTANLYIFSTAIKETFRDKPLTLNKNSKFYGKPAFQVLNEAMYKFIKQTSKKLNIQYILADIVSKHGKKYVESLHMKNISNTSKYHAPLNIYNLSIYHKQ